MKKEEILKEIDKLETEIFYEKMRDLNYSSQYVTIRQNRIRELKELLDQMK